MKEKYTKKYRLESSNNKYIITLQSYIENGENKISIFLDHFLENETYNFYNKFSINEIVKDYYFLRNLSGKELIDFLAKIVKGNNIIVNRTDKFLYNLYLYYKDEEIIFKVKRTINEENLEKITEKKEIKNGKQIQEKLEPKIEEKKQEEKESKKPKTKLKKKKIILLKKKKKQMKKI